MARSLSPVGPTIGSAELLARGFQRRIALDINPIGGFRRYMAGYTVNAVVHRSGFRGVAGIEPCPRPSVAPQGVLRMGVLALLHHHKPALQLLRAADCSRRHFLRACLEYLLHQHRSVRKTAILPIRFNRAW